MDIVWGLSLIIADAALSNCIVSFKSGQVADPEPSCKIEWESDDNIFMWDSEPSLCSNPSKCKVGESWFPTGVVQELAADVLSDPLKFKYLK